MWQGIFYANHVSLELCCTIKYNKATNKNQEIIKLPGPAVTHRLQYHTPLVRLLNVYTSPDTYLETLEAQIMLLSKLLIIIVDFSFPN